MGNRPLNVSQFIANLNNIDDSLDNYSSPTSSTSGTDITNRNAPDNSNNSGNTNQRSNYPHRQSHNDDDLSIFSNTHFFDFDMGCSTDIAVSVDDLLMQQEKQLQSKSFSSPSSSSNNSVSPANRQMDESIFQAQLDNLQQYSLANELLLNESTPYMNNTSNNMGDGKSLNNPKSPAQTFRKIPTRLQSKSAGFNPSIVGSQNPQHAPLSHTEFQPPSSLYNTASPVATQTPPASKKRKSSAFSVSTGSSPEDNAQFNDLDVDDPSRIAAEEDKRRRNTAASARFRIKKKLREQQMERTAKELQDKVQSLESKITQLEMENKWLKNLVVEKNEARDVNDLLDMKKKIMSGGVKSEN